VKENLAALIQALTERQRTAERRLSILSTQINALEARIAELSQSSALRDAAAAQAKAAQTTPRKPASAEVTPEIIVVLAAAAAAYLGKNVRVRSAKALQSPYGAVNLWAQQGRVSIQASHNWRLRR
jgi:methylmalonyl-CoA carboxyltransferase large subunit